jgi:hypothetical protein
VPISKKIFWAINFLVSILLILKFLSIKDDIRRNRSFLQQLRNDEKSSKVIIKKIYKNITLKDPFNSLLKKYFLMYINIDISSNNKNQSYVSDIIKNLKNIDERINKDINVVVVKKCEPIIFSLPGGIVIVSEEIFKTLETESELVSVTLHQILNTVNKESFNSYFNIISQKKIKNIEKLLEFSYHYFRNFEHSKVDVNTDDLALEIIFKTNYNPLSYLKSIKKINLRDDNVSIFSIKYQEKHFMNIERERNIKALVNKYLNEFPESKKLNGEKNFIEKISIFKKIFVENK